MIPKNAQCTMTHSWCPNMRYEIFLKYNVWTSDAPESTLEQRNMPKIYCTHMMPTKKCCQTKTSKIAVGMFHNLLQAPIIVKNFFQISPWCPKCYTYPEMLQCPMMPKIRQFWWPKMLPRKDFETQPCCPTHTCVGQTQHWLTSTHPWTFLAPRYS